MIADSPLRSARGHILWILALVLAAFMVLRLEDIDIAQCLAGSDSAEAELVVQAPR